MSAADFSLLIKAEWERYYPKENYKKETNGKHGITHYFHYFMNLQKDATVANHIKQAGIHVLTQRDEQVFGLTPLTIACMQGRTCVVEALLERFSKEPAVKLVEWLNTRDNFGWTPFVKVGRNF